jgi:hypothetical protein
MTKAIKKNVVAVAVKTVSAKSIAQAFNQATIENAIYTAHCEALADNAIYTAHCEALAIQLDMYNALLTNKERNAKKRSDNSNRTMSTFCKSLKTSSQAYRIDEALCDFHTMKELLALETLSDCTESRIKSHISFLQHNFVHACKIVSKTVDKKVFFKFENKETKERELALA